MITIAVGIAIGLLAVVFIATPAVLIARMQDKRELAKLVRHTGRRCAYRRPRAAAILAADLWHWARPQRLAAAALAAVDGWLRGGEFLLPPAPYLEPIVTDAEVREEFERLADERPGEIITFAGVLTEDEAAQLRADWKGKRNPVAPTPQWNPYPEQVPFTGWRVPDGHQLPAGRGLMFTRTPYPTAADPVTPAATDDDPPWDIETAQQPALDDEPRYALALGPDGCEEIA